MQRTSVAWWQRMWHKLSLKLNIPAMGWAWEIREDFLEEEEEKGK